MTSDPRSTPLVEPVPPRDPARVVRGLPRRPALSRGGDDAGPRGGRRRAARVGFVRVLRRLAWWAFGYFRYRIGVLFDRRSGLRRASDRAVRLRKTLQRMGGTTVHLWRQLSMRLDLLPFEVWYELSKIWDDAEPFPVEHAIGRVEDVSGRRLHEIFDGFDPQPIYSSAVCNIYQAVLLDGREVAVKVRRPGVLDELSVDLVAIDWVLMVLELLTIVRPGFFRYVRNEVQAMLHSELDFRQEARLQELFRRGARKAKVAGASAPRVLRDYSAEDVTVSEFHHGVRLTEVVEAVVHQDDDALATLERMGIDPRAVARQLLRVHWWSVFEGLFFHAEPNSYEIVIERGSRLIFLNFGDCHTTGDRVRRLHAQALGHLARDQVSHAAAATVQMLAPLPYIDVRELTTVLEGRLWLQHLAMRDRGGRWWDRTRVGLWAAILETALEFQVPIRLEVIHMMRASLLVDILVGRLAPGMDLLGEFKRYERMANRRRARRFVRDLDRASRKDPRTAVIGQLADLADRMGRIGFFVSSITHTPPIEFVSLTGKGAYAAAELLRFAGIAVGLVLLAVLARTTQAALAGEALEPGRIAADTLGQPVLALLLVWALVWTVRRISFRLGDLEKG